MLKPNLMHHKIIDAILSSLQQQVIFTVLITVQYHWTLQLIIQVVPKLLKMCIFVSNIESYTFLHERKSCLPSWTWQTMLTHSCFVRNSSSKTHGSPLAMRSEVMLLQLPSFLPRPIHISCLVVQNSILIVHVRVAPQVWHLSCTTTQFMVFGGRLCQYYKLCVCSEGYIQCREGQFSKS